MMLFDRAHFDAMTGGDAALQAEVIALFQGQVAGWEEGMSAPGRWRDIVHTIKGSARGIGLWDLAAACETAESAQNEDIAVATAPVRAALKEALAALAD